MFSDEVIKAANFFPQCSFCNQNSALKNYQRDAAMFVKCGPHCVKIKEVPIHTTDCLSFEIHFVVHLVHFHSMKRTENCN